MSPSDFRASRVLPAAIREQQQSQQRRGEADTLAAVALSARPQMERAVLWSHDAQEHHIAGGQIRISRLSSQASGQQDGESGPWGDALNLHWKT